MTARKLLLLFFEEISAIAKCGRILSVHLQNFTNFWCFCVLLYYALEFSS